MGDGLSFNDFNDPLTSSYFVKKYTYPEISLGTWPTWPSNKIFIPGFFGISITIIRN